MQNKPMEENVVRYTVQGTVQVEINANVDDETVRRKGGSEAEDAAAHCEERAAVRVAISPVPDYCVRHEKNDYIVFMRKGGDEAKAFGKSTRFEVANDVIRRVLIDTASTGIRVELEISGTSIVAVRIPAALKL